MKYPHSLVLKMSLKRSDLAVYCRQILTLIFVLLLTSTIATSSALAAKRRRKAKHYGPNPTHPVVLWARTLLESADRDQRKIAAFKLSQYSQSIFQEEALRALFQCSKDIDVEIRVLCAKALGKAGTSSQADNIRQLLLERYKTDPLLRNTIVRAFMARQDGSLQVQETLLSALKSSSNVEERLALLKYFVVFGSGSNDFSDALVDVFKKSDNPRIQNAVVEALSARGKGQDNVITLLTQCTESHNTPLVLNCLAGLQQQGKKDPRTWLAVEKTIKSDDPDVLMATLDVINSMPENPNVAIATRLVELMGQVEDEDLQEKIILSLGVAGDQGQSLVGALLELMQNKSVDDGVKTAAALTLGKQADQYPDKAQEVLSGCSTASKSQTLRTACQLGGKEIKARQLLNAENAKAKGLVTESTAGSAQTTAERKPADKETDQESGSAKKTDKK